MRLFAALFLVFMTSTAAMAGVTLQWDANQETDLAGYRIYQAEPGGEFARVGEVQAPATTLTLEVTPQDGREVRFVATAFDTAGNESAHSNMVRYTVPDATPPKPPVNLLVHGIDQVISGLQDVRRYLADRE